MNCHPIYLSAIAGLILALGACFVDVDERACFGGGPERLLDLEGSTEVCCDPTDPLGPQTCRDFYRGGTFEGVIDLAACTPQGRCGLDCREGVNCGCLLGRDCGPDFGCVTTSNPAICAHHGQLGEQRCSLCEDCLVDTDCAEHPLGTRCNNAGQGNPGLCGCEVDADCAEGQTCDRGACQ